MQAAALAMIQHLTAALSLLAGSVPSDPQLLLVQSTLHVWPLLLLSIMTLHGRQPLQMILRTVIGRPVHGIHDALIILQTKLLVKWLHGRRLLMNVLLGAHTLPRL